jgi:hypothetical protein
MRSWRRRGGSMTIFRTHILIPVDPNTVQAGVFEVKRHLESQLQAHNSTRRSRSRDRNPQVVGQGVILVVFPEGLLYPGEGRGYPRIVEEHLVKGGSCET